MKQIQPVSIWQNGVNAQATQLLLVIINDNLSTSATLFYQLLTDEQNAVANGNVIIDGTDYENWGNSGDINDDAYSIAASKLSLTLV